MLVAVGISSSSSMMDTVMMGMATGMVVVEEESCRWRRR